MTESRINWRLQSRLDDAKRKAVANVENRAKVAANYPGAAPEFVDWREVARDNAKRRYRRPAIWNPPYTDSRGQVWRWLESVDASGLIVVVENATEKANGHRCTGYYIDTFADQSQHGAVLATRDPESPKARFFAAIADPHNDGAYRILWEPESDLDSAIRSADSEAERAAEKERDYSAAWQAGSYWSQLGEEVADARREALAILRDRKSASGSETLCKVIREKVESLMASIKRARAQRERLVKGRGCADDDYYRAFWPGDRRLQAAFNEGADSPVFTLSAA